MTLSLLLVQMCMCPSLNMSILCTRMKEKFGCTWNCLECGNLFRLEYGYMSSLLTIQAIGEGWMEGGREGGRKCRGRKGGIEEGGIKEGGSTKLTLLEKKIFSLKMSLSFSPHSW